MDLSSLKKDSAGLVTVVAQDRHSGEVRMVAHANDEAIRQTLATREAHFFSRSRNALWRKGESSGNTMRVSEVWIDCDRDALIYLVDPIGPTCHTGAETCFFTRMNDGAASQQVATPTLFALFAELASRRDAPAEKSYTRSLLDAGASKIAAKVREECDELARALEGESNERVISEAADVLYHVFVGLLARGVTLRDVAIELARRAGISGHSEKASRSKG
ncbi:MAG: bifunctional phosphoribosyl-AMP cyclohydrolase/phosphoribosyl-ATP diphosphatase HisIE [Sandaracinaceae bacterium]|nr:bifunctional phosphoribosyl-AMP cyclohydrolase/phosphoribosyl-ATP diphosphatase HisIE [Sandaracinaceae bacterium]